MATPTYSNNGKTFRVRETGGRFFYFSDRATRWLPVAKSKVSFA